jgi:hypothetical protein
VATRPPGGGRIGLENDGWVEVTGEQLVEWMPVSPPAKPC